MSTLPRPEAGTRVSLDEYEDWIARGVLPEDWRGELVEGELVEMLAANPPHEDLVDFLMEWSVRVLDGSEWKARVEKSLRMAKQESLVEPDISWVRRMRYRDRRVTPEDTLLVIEVSDSSLPYDRGRKLSLYAKGGVTEVWIVSVVGRTLESHSHPVAGRYTRNAKHESTATVSPAGFPSAKLVLAELFGGD
jgi:Uma2 family endonuclease